MIESGEQHLPYRESCKEVITDEDGRRWVREGVATLPSWADGVPVPVDKNGNVVPLDTMKLVDAHGDKREIEFIGYRPKDNSWFVHFTDDWAYVPLDDYALVSNDSLGKLADDLERYVNGDSCSYFGMAADPTCDGCPASDCEEECASVVLEDAVRRVRAIREAERDED